MALNFVAIVKCRSCSGSALDSVLNLGNQPLANSLLSKADKDIAKNEVKIPLELLFCQDCGLLQLGVNVNPEIMFEKYFWVTGTSSQAHDHCNNIIRQLNQHINFNNKKVLEIGSNDGTLLQKLKTKSTSILVGVEPAKTLKENYNENEIHFENRYFTSLTARDLVCKYGTFDLVIARNVFSHVPDFRDVIRGVETLISEDGIFLMEFHWSLEILQNLHFDSIYHEHTYYHSLNSVEKIFEEFQLKIIDVFESPTSGGSLAVVVVRQRGNVQISENTNYFKEREVSYSINEFATWKQFGELAKENIAKTKKLLKDQNGRMICGFGASARSSTLLNCWGKEANELKYIADNNPRKWGKYSPGTHVEIQSVENVLEKSPDVFVLFAFNFESEILFQLREKGWKGKIIRPIPHPPLEMTLE